MEFTADVGTTRYMAPEVVFGAYNEKADVFSYAMLLWELMHVKIPFKDSQLWPRFSLSLAVQAPFDRVGAGI